MAQKLNQQEITTLDELFWVNVYQLDEVTHSLSASRTCHAKENHYRRID